MIEITGVVNMVPAMVMFREDGQDKSVLVYIDYLGQNVIPTEDIGPLEEFRLALFEQIAKSMKPVKVPTVPQHGLDLKAKTFDNSD